LVGTGIEPRGIDGADQAALELSAFFAKNMVLWQKRTSEPLVIDTDLITMRSESPANEPDLKP
jgi:hypothetical protein